MTSVSPRRISAKTTAAHPYKTFPNPLQTSSPSVSNLTSSPIKVPSSDIILFFHNSDLMSTVSSEPLMIVTLHVYKDDNVLSTTIPTSFTVLHLLPISNRPIYDEHAPFFKALVLLRIIHDRPYNVLLVTRSTVLTIAVVACRKCVSHLSL